MTKMSENTFVISIILYTSQIFSNINSKFYQPLFSVLTDDHKGMKVGAIYIYIYIYIS